MNSALLFAMVSASLKEDFDAAQISEGMTYLHQPTLSAKLQKDSKGSMRGFLKDIHEGKLSYSKMDFSPDGVLIAHKMESTPSGGPAFKGIAYRKVADYFIPEPRAEVGGVDNYFYSQRLTHEGRRLQRSLNDVLEVYKFKRTCGEKLCFSVMRREPARAGGKATLKVLEHARSYDVAEQEAGLKGIQKNFDYSEETTTGNSKQQFWKYCFGDYCKLSEQVTKTVRVVRKGENSNSVTESVAGEHVYNFYKKNANKAESVDFETLKNECTSESELPSPGNIQFSKCGEGIVKMTIGEHIYLFKDAEGKLSEATNAPTSFGETLPADKSANTDFSKGAQKVNATGSAIAGNGGAITEPAQPANPANPSTSASFLVGVCFALLF